MPHVTLQVNMAPIDGRHVGKILPHQLRQFGGQVDEILVVVDLDRPRMVDPGVWEAGEQALRGALACCCERDPRIHVIDVDPSPAVARRVADEFFGGEPIPARSWRGGPIYAYFFGLWAARHDYVLHMDADMLYGGGSQSWVAEAVELLRSRSDVLVCSPLPGPPCADGGLVSQDLPREPLASPAFRADEVSTRVFMTDRRRWSERVGALRVTRPSLRRRLIGRSNGNGPFASAERSMSVAMLKCGMTRIDFLGSGRGMWSVHPPHRCEHFYERLAELVVRIEMDDVPDVQRGRHDVHDAMVDWSAARVSWGRRTARRGQTALRLVTPRQRSRDPGPAVAAPRIAPAAEGTPLVPLVEAGAGRLVPDGTMLASIMAREEPVARMAAGPAADR